MVHDRTHLGIIVYDASEEVVANVAAHYLRASCTNISCTPTTCASCTRELRLSQVAHVSDSVSNEMRTTPKWPPRERPGLSARQQAW